jgi:hypothetical protein
VYLQWPNILNFPFSEVSMNVDSVTATRRTDNLTPAKTHLTTEELKHKRNYSLSFYET